MSPTLFTAVARLKMNIDIKQISQISEYFTKANKKSKGITMKRNMAPEQFKTFCLHDPFYQIKTKFTDLNYNSDGRSLAIFEYPRGFMLCFKFHC